MSKLYLFNYNNYFNRIIKRGVTLSDYGTPVYSLSNTNFQENDGVTTSHVINYNAYDGDYIVITDDNDVIKSRWFVVENVKQRGGQHSLSLRRDLIADYYNSIINAPALINRAKIKDPNSPLLFNTEGFIFNQIKEQEILLKDRTKTPWYIMYFALNTASKTINISDSSVDVPYDYAISVGVDDNSNPFKAGHYHFIDEQKYEINYGAVRVGYTTLWESYKLFDNIYGTASGNYNEDTFVKFNESREVVRNKLQTQFTSLKRATMNTYLNNMITANDGFKSIAEFETINEMPRTFILKATASGITNYYTVRVQITTSPVTTVKPKTGTGGTDLFNYVKNQITASGLTIDGEYGENAVQASYVNYDINIDVSLYEVPGATYTFTIDFANKATPSDAPYHIIAIPKYTVDIETADAYVCPQNINEAMVNGIIKEYSDGASLLDVQLLPYFPYEPDIKYISSQDTRYASVIEFTDSNLIASQYQLIGTANSGKCGVIFYLNKSSFTLDISQTLNIKNRENDIALNKKLSNELDIYRICSPNYNGIFEFSVAKNNGVNLFNVDVTLRPFNPYIHINPNFKSLYGSDFNDARGLICQGDFSLPIITDQFKQYEYQNKNYLNVFNRNIEHMDFEFSKQRTEALFGAITGSIGAGISGGLTGGMVGGGPLGVGIGAGIGTIASAIGGAVDYNILKQRQAEAKDLTIDQFKYNLGNIKALTYSVNKITCLTYNNKIWPFIEVYSATDQEANILKQKIIYNSMVVNAIGTLSEYIDTVRTFISASLIRLEDLNVPTHEANEIYDEMMKGVYI